MFAGCLSRNLLRQPAKGTPPEIKAEWLMLDEPHSDSSRVILYLPGPFFCCKADTIWLASSEFTWACLFFGGPPNMVVSLFLGFPLKPRKKGTLKNRRAT